MNDVTDLIPAAQFLQWDCIVAHYIRGVFVRILLMFNTYVTDLLPFTDPREKNYWEVDYQVWDSMFLCYRNYTAEPDSVLSSTFGIRDKKLRLSALVRENWWLSFEKKDYQTGKTLILLPVLREKVCITLEMFGFWDSQLPWIDCSSKIFLQLLFLENCSHYAAISLMFLFMLPQKQYPF